MIDSSPGIDPEPPKRRRVVQLLRKISGLPTPVVFAAALAFAVLVLWWQGSLDDVRTAIKEADRTTVLTGLALYPGALAVLCYRWHLLVRMVSGVSDASKAVQAFLTSVVLNYTAPVSVASASRAALTTRDLKVTGEQAGAAALTELVIDLSILAGGSLLWFALSGHAADAFAVLPASALYAAIVLVIAVIGAGAGAAVLARRRGNVWFRIKLALETIRDAPRQRPRDAAASAAFSVLYWLAQGIVLWALVRAVAGTSDVTLVLGLLTVPVLLGMLSGLPGGAGVREALMVVVAEAHGADSAEVLVAAVTYRAALFAAIPLLYLIVRLWIGLERRADGHADPSAASHTLEGKR